MMTNELTRTGRSFCFVTLGMMILFFLQFTCVLEVQKEKNDPKPFSCYLSDVKLFSSTNTSWSAALLTAKEIKGKPDWKHNTSSLLPINNLCNNSSCQDLLMTQDTRFALFDSVRPSIRVCIAYEQPSQTAQSSTSAGNSSLRQWLRAGNCDLFIQSQRVSAKKTVYLAQAGNESWSLLTEDSSEITDESLVPILSYVTYESIGHCYVEREHLEAFPTLYPPLTRLTVLHVACLASTLVCLGTLVHLSWIMVQHGDLELLFTTTAAPQRNNRGRKQYRPSRQSRNKNKQKSSEWRIRTLQAWERADMDMTAAAATCFKHRALSKSVLSPQLASALPRLRKTGEDKYRSAMQTVQQLSEEDKAKFWKAQERNKNATCFDELVTKAVYENLEASKINSENTKKQDQQEAPDTDNHDQPVVNVPPTISPVPSTQDMIAELESLQPTDLVASTDSQTAEQLPSEK